MSLIGSASSFVLIRSGKSSQCSECRKEIPAHSYALVSSRHGRVVKRVCSDGCRETFDDRFWQERADEGRRASGSVYALEIEPAYVDVTVARWEDFTGQKAQRKK